MHLSNLKYYGAYPYGILCMTDVFRCKRPLTLTPECSLFTSPCLFPKEEELKASINRSRRAYDTLRLVLRRIKAINSTSSSSFILSSSYNVEEDEEAKKRVHCASQVSGDVRSKNKRLNDRDYRGMLLHHSGNQKMPMSKSETQPLAQEAP